MKVGFFNRPEQNFAKTLYRCLCFWSLSIETGFGMNVCTVDCLRPLTEKYSGNILSLTCSKRQQVYLFVIRYD